MFLLKNKIFYSIQLALFVFFVIINCQLVLAANGPLDKFNSSLNKTGGAAGYTTNSGKTAEQTLTKEVGTIISEVLSFLGVVFLILMIYGGYVWMKARGNETDVKRARDIIIDALLGLIIVVAAYAISYFVINALQPSVFAV
jgi:hypothetical protein